MSKTYTTTYTRTRTESALATNSVIRNTYILLSLTLFFSALMAGVGMVSGAAPLGFLGLIGAFGLLFLTQALRNSVWGIVSIFGFTGLLGYSLGPVLNMYISHFSNGSEIVMTALGGTGVIFLSLSGYALTTKKDFSYLTGFIAAASMILFIAIIASLFIQIPAFHLAISAGIMLLMAGSILWETSQIIHGGQTNYILATMSLYLSIYNLFVSLLHILGALSGRE